MKKPIEKSKLLILAIIGFFVLSVGAIGFTAYGNSSNTDVNNQITNLLNKLQLATQNELTNGETKDTPYGKIFTGQSADKMNNLNDETQKQIDDLIARPEKDRQLAIAEIKKFSKNKDIQINYKRTSKSSYNADIPVEIYYADSDQYEIDARNNQIIQFGPRPITEEEQAKTFDTSARYSEKDLEKMARQFISENTSFIDLSGLSRKNANKEQTSYFFRWEDTTREVEEMHPFIQVGFSRGGSLLSYTNSLGL